MAYDQYLADRINRILQSKNINYYDKKMMGGLVFMVNGKMCCGIHIDKKYGDSLLMAKLEQNRTKQKSRKMFVYQWTLQVDQ